MGDRHVIYCLMGKSASGKDTIYRALKERAEKSREILLQEVVPYTTRPMREGEKDGEAYYFRSDAEFERAGRKGQIIESRDYSVVSGIWHYYTEDDGQIDLTRQNYLLIGTLESYGSFCRYYGKENVVPLYVELEAGERLQRALDREKREPHPRYAELCRRFLADEADFSEEKLKAAGICERFTNEHLEDCVEEIWKKICQESDLTG